MEIDEILSTVSEIAIDTFDDDTLVITPAIGKENIETWNSLGHIRLLTEIEEEFGVEFTIDEISEINTIGQIVELVGNKINP